MPSVSQTEAVREAVEAFQHADRPVKMTFRHRDTWVVTWNLSPEEILIDEPQLFFRSNGRTLMSVRLDRLGRPEEHEAGLRLPVGDDGAYIDLHKADDSQA